MYKKLAFVNGIILAVRVFFNGMLANNIYLDIFSKSKAISGVLFLIGLIINAKVDSKYKSLKLSENV